MEIERKFLLKELPKDLSIYKCKIIEQGYLCTNPVVRIRKSNDTYELTYKGKGFMAREEYNLALNEEAYYHLKEKIDGNIISKKRYLIPIHGNLTVELDIFEKPFDNIILAEVEFETEDDANNFIPPAWFGEDVSYDKHYHNSYLSSLKLS